MSDEMELEEPFTNNEPSFQVFTCLSEAAVEDALIAMNVNLSLDNYLSLAIRCGRQNMITAAKILRDIKALRSDLGVIVVDSYNVIVTDEYMDQPYRDCWLIEVNDGRGNGLRIFTSGNCDWIMQNKEPWWKQYDKMYSEDKE